MRYLRKKQIILIVIAGITLFLFGHAVRADVISAGLPSFAQQAQSPADFVKSLYDYALGVVAAAAVIMIVYGGVKYVASGGSVAAKSDAMDIIKNAIFGIVLLFGGYIILYTINPELVNLKNPTVPNSPTLLSNSGSSSDARTGDCVITATPSSGPSPLVVTFSSDVDAAASFSWTFGDGSAGSSDRSPSHTFQNNGIYTVSLRTVLPDPTGGGNDTIHSCTLQLTVGTAGGGRISPELQAAAKALQNSGVSFSGTGQCGGVTPSQNINDMAAGNYPKVCSCDCPSTCPVGGSSGTVAVSAAVLTGLTHVKQGGMNFQINSLTGDKHSCPTASDPHYQGRAADVVPVPRTNDVQTWGALFSALQSNGGSPHYECRGVFTTDVLVFKSGCYSGGSMVPNTHIHVEF
jgi:hypothetical protein